MVLGVAHDQRFAAANHDALDGLAKADRASMEARRHMGVGEPAAPVHRGSEFRATCDPAFDDGRRHLEELRQLVITGAELAVVARELAVFRPVAGGMVVPAHATYIDFL